MAITKGTLYHIFCKAFHFFIQFSRKCKGTNSTLVRSAFFFFTVQYSSSKSVSNPCEIGGFKKAYLKTLEVNRMNKSKALALHL